MNLAEAQECRAWQRAIRATLVVLAEQGYGSADPEQLMLVAAMIWAGQEPVNCIPPRGNRYAAALATLIGAGELEPGRSGPDASAGWQQTGLAQAPAARELAFGRRLATYLPLANTRRLHDYRNARWYLARASQNCSAAQALTEIAANLDAAPERAEARRTLAITRIIYARDPAFAAAPKPRRPTPA